MRRETRICDWLWSSRIIFLWISKNCFIFVCIIMQYIACLEVKSSIFGLLYWKTSNITGRSLEFDGKFQILISMTFYFPLEWFPVSLEVYWKYFWILTVFFKIIFHWKDFYSNGNFPVCWKVDEMLLFLWIVVGINDL